MGISHLYLYLTDLCPIRQNVRLKNTFADIAYNVLVKTKVLQLFKNKWWTKRKIKKWFNQMKNYFKQLAVQFKRILV